MTKLQKQSRQTLRRGTKKAGTLLKFPYYVARQHATGKIQGAYRQHQARKRVREKERPNKKMVKKQSREQAGIWSLTRKVGMTTGSTWFNVKIVCEGTAYFSQVDPTTKKKVQIKDTHPVGMFHFKQLLSGLTQWEMPIVCPNERIRMETRV